MLFSYKTLLITVAAAGLAAGCSNVTEIFSPVPQNAQTADVSIGRSDANQAMAKFGAGDNEGAKKYADKALSKNPYQPHALLVNALVAEQEGRPNSARKYYEDIILRSGNETTSLATTDFKPIKIADLAQQKLKLINIEQSNLLIEGKNGIKEFKISNNASQEAGKSAIEEALFKREQKNISASKAETEANVKATELLFTDKEKNIISRFLIFKELAENGLITKDEFLNSRNTNIGGLLPLTHSAPSFGVDKAVPSADVIIDRISVLKESVENRSITPREYSAERGMIIEALLPTNPRKRMEMQAPKRDILEAAKGLRKLEVLYELNLVTSREKQAEQKAIENVLGINAPAPTDSVDENGLPNVSAPF